LDISRVLFSLCKRAVIYLGRLLPNASSGCVCAEPVKDQPWFLCLAPNRGLPSQRLSTLLVRSYRTFAPLPVMDAFLHPSIGGMFLWHFPRDRSHWALPSRFGLSGARTFLKPACYKTGLQPPAPTLFLYLV